MLKLKPFSPEDADDCSFLFETRTHHEVAVQLLQPPPPNFSTHKSYLDGLTERGIDLFLVWDNPGGYYERIGYAQAQAKGSAVVELGWVIHPKFQGQGYGKRAVWAWMAHNKQRGRSFELSVKQSNARAISLYQKFGFQKVEVDYGTQVVKMERSRNLTKVFRMTSLGHADFILNQEGACETVEMRPGDELLIGEQAAFVVERITRKNK